MVVFIILDGCLNQLLIEAHLSLHLLNKLAIHVEFFRVEAKIIIFRLMKLVEGVTS